MFRQAQYYPAKFFIAFLLFCNAESNGQCIARFDFIATDLTVNFINLSDSGVTVFEWNFGDGNTSSLSNPNHTYQAAGEYIVTLKAGTPIGICDSTSRRVCLRCIFPGDANNDGIVNNKDVLYVGLAYGAIGPQRHNASPDSLAPSTPWVMSTGPANFHGGSNINHADCDGDGIINRHDLSIIDRNYGFSNNKTQGNDCIDINDIPLYFEILDSIPVGTNVNVAIMLGTSQLPAQDVYGIAYSIHYSQELIEPGTVNLNYSNSLFGTSNDVIFLNKDSSQTGKIETAITRIDHNDLTIAGRIGTVGFVMEENLAQKTIITEILNLSFADITLIRSDETVIPVCGWLDSAIVYEKLLTGGSGDLRQEKRISVYPNPSNETLILELPQNEVYKISMMNALGKKVLGQDGKQEKLMLDVSQFVRGIYFLIVTNESTVETFKIEISR